MSKRSLDEHRDPKPAQADTLPDTYGDNLSQIVEMAAEQVADLLWRHWLYMKKKNLEKRDPKEPDS